MKSDIDITLMSEEHVKEIINWKYEKPYDVYNMPSYEVAKKAGWAIMNEEKRNCQFRSVIKNNELIAYFRAQAIDDYILLGLGMKPELCGRGQGQKLITEFINYIRESYKEFINIRLNVRKFNIRVIKCYKNVGFNITSENEIFFNMEYKI